MGCISSKSSESVSSKNAIRDITPLKKISEIKITSELYDRIRKVGSFKCQITSLLTLHNYICLAWENKDVHSLLVFDDSINNILKTYENMEDQNQKTEK